MIGKVIISDTSCLIALNKITKLDILRLLFGSVVITREVAIEYGEPLPPWITIQSIQNKKIKEELQDIVDEGEASAIALALETTDCLLIIDEKKGRAVAKNSTSGLQGLYRYFFRQRQVVSYHLYAHS